MGKISNILISILTSFVFVGGCTAPSPSTLFIGQARSLHDQALQSTLIVDQDLHDYFHELGNRIGQAALAVEPSKVNPDFIAMVQCDLVNCDTINVYSTGGVHVYVYNGLFQQCQFEDELAFAIAHAFAHLVNRDLEATRMHPDANLDPSMSTWGFVSNRFSLAQEKEADTLAVAIVGKAGWDAGRASSLFGRAETIIGGNVAVDRLPLPTRIANIQGLAADARPSPRALPIADPQTFMSLRQRAAQFHEPPGPPVSVLYLRAFPNCILSFDTPEQREAQDRLRPKVPGPVQGIEPN